MRKIVFDKRTGVWFVMLKIMNEYHRWQWTIETTHSTETQATETMQLTAQGSD